MCLQCQLFFNMWYIQKSVSKCVCKVQGCQIEVHVNVFLCESKGDTYIQNTSFAVWIYYLQIVKALDYLKEKHGVIHRGKKILPFILSIAFLI